ncbi:hypothetical protein Tco_0661525 [Tanacetum coccineum]
MAEVQLTAAQNVLANEQQHTDQSKPSYDTYLLEKVDSNTTPDSTNMCHRGGESDQDAEQYQAKSAFALRLTFLQNDDMPTQRRQSGIAFRDSFIVSKKRSSDSSKKLKGIQTLTPAEQEAADIMKALKESKKMSKRQPGTGGSNEGTGNILGVPDESTVISRASSEGTGSKPGVPDEEKLIL